MLPGSNANAWAVIEEAKNEGALNPKKSRKKASAQLYRILEEFLKKYASGIPTELPFEAEKRRSVFELFNIDPSLLGKALTEAIGSQQDLIGRLEAALEPFEKRQTEESVAALRESLGSMGGRFSSNLLRNEAALRSMLSESFAKTRAEANLQAMSERNKVLGDIIKGISSAYGDAGASTTALYGMLDMPWTEKAPAWADAAGLGVDILRLLILYGALKGGRK